MNMPLVSIIIPVYNAEKYLRACVNSVLAQTYQNLEIILVDDGSTDASAQTCDEYASKDKRVHVIHQPNAGVSAARNAGLDAAKGQYIGFVDADDYIYPDMYQYLHNLIISHKVEIAVCNVCQTLKGKNKLKLPPGIPSVMTGKQAIWRFMGSFFLWNKLFAAHLFKNRRFDHSITYCEDKLLLLPLFFQTEKVAYGAEGKYHYTLNAQSCTEQFSTQNLSFLKVQDKLIAFATAHHDTKLAVYLEQQKVGFSVRCLRQIAQSNYNDPQVITQLLQRVRTNIWPYIMGRASLVRKIFALGCCINFPLVAKIFRLCKKNKQ